MARENVLVRTLRGMPIAMELLLLIGLLWLIFKTARWAAGSFSRITSEYDDPASDAPARPLHRATATHRRISFLEEQQAAQARQRLWIRYEDYNGNESERKIDIYCPKEDDDYIFAWCCLKQAPRTFNRNKILAWRVLDERFTFNPLVERYFQEEGQRGLEEKISWSRWKETHS